MIAGLLTEIPGSSDVFERGFVTYSNEAKEDLLGVPADLIHQHGAVSEPVARAMARRRAETFPGAARGRGHRHRRPGRRHGGKAGGAGLYRRRCARAARPPAQEFRFGDIGRGEVRSRTVAEALALLRSLV